MNYKTEADIYKAGGRIAENYRGLINYLDMIDSYALDVLCALGMASDKEEYLKYSHTHIITLKRAYVAKKVDKIALKIEEAVKEADSEGREYKGIPIIDKFATFKTGKDKGLPFSADILHDGEMLRRKITQKIVQKVNKEFEDIINEIFKRTWKRFEATYKNIGLCSKRPNQRVCRQAGCFRWESVAPDGRWMCFPDEGSPSMVP